MPNKIVLAYSGGLDTSVILKWLIERYQCPVIAFCADLGQEEDWEEIKQKGLSCGAEKVIIRDLKEEFVKEYVFFAIKAGARYEDWYLMGTSLARPLIAKEQIKIAFEEGADAVAHGATGKGNDQVRFELTFSALAPHLKVIAPWREWDFKGRQDLIAYAQKHGIPIPVTPEKPYSIDANLFHISYEGGILEDLWTEPPEDMFLMTVSPEKAPDKPEYIEIEFERGEPIAVNGEKLSPANLLKRLNEIGGRHGVGRIDMVENRFVGLKSRGIYETPGGTILHIAHRALEQITLDREVMRLKDSLMPKIAEMIYYGFWFSPEFQALKTMVEQTQERVSGTIRVKLYKGNVMIAGRKSPNSLYKKRLVSFEEKEGYNPKDAEGFIRLQGLRLKIYNLSKEEEA
ncbi:MAG: Argininosuccinate synthase [Thermodesulfobacterium sp. 37_54]|uniref:Argininosuccinate synthase n=1 Tax=Thermodesulfobacterium commune TaxID=1741 RepID=A0A117LCI8_9BACT|nr:argininosuccinate synthase [Thermodesulfobacterium sp.]KUJ98320.1 MAG: Argininosuccinate synthase [Thermodesulfobacterium sp. 37_54]KUK19911.1 MAG: Argininosuccinate synthase [Thermodesulfobacterium commune]KUK38306.1 MAG: Argininosuccinate synthase [Thermodesulfobacterium commune]MDN5379957.1 argininosuccinate synthase [Thermodesulfobacterium sp.]HAA83253.1 argininosuccinate synthase [Thermodesulfobacterium commune]